MSSIGFQRSSGGQAFWSRLSRGSLAPKIAEWLLIGIIAFLLARATIAFFAPLPVPKGDTLAALPAVQQNPSALSARNPFPAGAAAGAPVEVSQELEETALDLKLTGVWPEQEGGSAIIRRPDGKERRFAVGDEIVSGVMLVATYGDQVVIEQNGVRESLRFESKAPVERRVANQPSVAPSTPPPNQAPTQTPDKIRNTPGDSIFASAFRMAPGQNAAGQPAIQLFAGRNGAVFEAAGLRNGDVLVSINGAPAPQSPDDLIGAMQNAAQSGSVKLVVEREGALQDISLTGNRSGN